MHLKLDLFKFTGTEYIALDSVITETLLNTTASISRILSRKESHILLAGPTGSCKIDAIYISCTFLGLKLMSITPLKNYNINDFYNDLKMVKVFLFRMY